MYDQRDIVLIPFPYTDLTGSKKRPALIISNEKINKDQDRICCLVTRKQHKNYLEITKSSFYEGSLPFKSFVKPQRIFTINEKIIIKKLCRMNNKLHDNVINKINEYLKRNDSKG